MWMKGEKTTVHSLNFVQLVFCSHELSMLFWYFQGCSIVGLPSPGSDWNSHHSASASQWSPTHVSCTQEEYVYNFDAFLLYKAYSLFRKCWSGISMFFLWKLNYMLQTAVCKGIRFEHHLGNVYEIWGGGLALFKCTMGWLNDPVTPVSKYN